MSTLSVPLTPQIETSINKLLQSGFATNKAEVARKAILRIAEEEAIESVLKSEREVQEGKILPGDLKNLMNLID